MLARLESFSANAEILPILQVLVTVEIVLVAVGVTCRLLLIAGYRCHVGSWWKYVCWPRIGPIFQVLALIDVFTQDFFDAHDAFAFTILFDTCVFSLYLPLIISLLKLWALTLLVYIVLRVQWSDLIYIVVNMFCFSFLLLFALFSYLCH